MAELTPDDYKAEAIRRGLIKPQNIESNPVGGISKSESFLRGAAQGATLNFGDEASAALELGAGKLFGNPAYKGKSFSDLVSENRKTNTEAFKAHPVYSVAGNIVGGGVVAAPLGGATVVAANPIKAATVLGAIQGYGGSESKDIKGQILDTAVGGALGFGAGALSKAITSSPQAVEKASVDLTRRALGFNKSAINKAGGLKEANQAAKTVLESGGIISPFKDIDDMAVAVTQLKQSAGSTMGEVLKKLDDAGIEGIDTGALVSTIRNAKIAPKFSQTVAELSKVPALKELAKPLQSALETIKNVSSGKGTINFQKAQELKQIFSTMADFTSNTDKPANLLAVKMYGVLNEAIDNAVEAGAPKINQPDLLRQFLDAKKSYGAASKAEMAVKDAIDRAAGNRKIGLTDSLAILGGIGAGGHYGSPGAGALAALWAKKIIEDRGFQTAASALNVVGQSLKGAKNTATGLLGKIGAPKDYSATIPLTGGLSSAISRERGK